MKKEKDVMRQKYGSGAIAEGITTSITIPEWVEVFTAVKGEKGNNREIQARVIFDNPDTIVKWALVGASIALRQAVRNDEGTEYLIDSHGVSDPKAHEREIAKLMEMMTEMGNPVTIEVAEKMLMKLKK